MKRSLIKVSGLVLTFLSVALFSFEAHADSKLEETVLGQQLPNPYLLQNMIVANAALHGKAETNLSTTHLYVRFQPDTAKQMDDLSKLPLDIYDYPMDHEVISEGDYYHNPEIPEDKFTFLYAAVPAKMVIPANIPHTVLAQLYLPDETDEGEELEDKSFELLGLDVEDTSESVGKVQASSASSGAVAKKKKRYTPTGHIMATDTVLGVVPARNVKVKARHWFKTAKGHTDANGFFILGKKFRKKIHLNVDFDNGNAEIRDFKRIVVAAHRLFFPARFSMGDFTKGGIETIYSVMKYSQRRGVIAAINNSIEKYRDKAMAAGLPLPPSNLLIFADEGPYGKGSASTPMLNHIGSSTLLPDFVSMFFGAIQSIFYEVLEHNLPDMTINWNQNVTQVETQEMVATMYHELSHTIHYGVVGNSYWVDVIMDILNVSKNSNCYGDVNQPEADRLGLTEGWAEFLGKYFSNQDYPTAMYNVVSGSNTMSTMTNEVYLEETIPFYGPNICGNVSGWIPYGFFYDMTDSVNTGINSAEFLYDEIGLYTPAQLFSQLNQQSFQAYALALKAQVVVPNDIGKFDNLYNWYAY